MQRTELAQPDERLTGNGIAVYKYKKGNKHQEEWRATDVIENGCTITNMSKQNDCILKKRNWETLLSSNHEEICFLKQIGEFMKTFA